MWLLFGIDGDVLKKRNSFKKISCKTFGSAEGSEKQWTISILFFQLHYGQKFSSRFFSFAFYQEEKRLELAAKKIWIENMYQYFTWNFQFSFFLVPCQQISNKKLDNIAVDPHRKNITTNTTRLSLSEHIKQ